MWAPAKAHRLGVPLGRARLRREDDLHRPPSEVDDACGLLCDRLLSDRRVESVEEVVDSDPSVEAFVEAAHHRRPLTLEEEPRRLQLDAHGGEDRILCGFADHAETSGRHQEDGGGGAHGLGHGGLGVVEEWPQRCARTRRVRLVGGEPRLDLMELVSDQVEAVLRAAAAGAPGVDVDARAAAPRVEDQTVVRLRRRYTPQRRQHQGAAATHGDNGGAFVARHFLVRHDSYPYVGQPGP